MIPFKMMDFCKKNAFLLFCLLIFLRPFISSVAFPGIEKYQLLFLAAVSIVFLKEIDQKKIPGTIKAGLFFFIMGCASFLIFPSNKLNSLINLPNYLAGILFFLTGFALNTRQIKRVLKITLLSGVLISLYGIYQYLFGFSDMAKYILEKNPALFTNHLVRNYFLSRRVFATFFSPNMLAGYLIIIIPIALGYIFEFMPLRKFFPNLALGILFLTLIMTKSLGAILSLSLSLIFFFIMLHKKEKKFSPKILFAGILILVLLLSVIAGEIVNTRFERIFNFQNPHNSLLQRLNFLRLSSKIIKDHPFFGVGAGNFGDFYMRYRGMWDIRTSYAHNFIMQIQAELGMLGTIGLALLLIAFLRDIFSYWGDKDSSNSCIRAGLLSAGLSFLLHNLMDVSFFIPEVGVFFWVSWACFKNLGKQKIPPF